MVSKSLMPDQRPFSRYAVSQPLNNAMMILNYTSASFVEKLKVSFAGSAQYSLPHNQGQPWWYQTCRKVRKIFREISRHGTPSEADGKAYRKVINAKSRFFRKSKLKEASSAKDAFEISKWHESKGCF